MQLRKFHSIFHLILICKYRQVRPISSWVTIDHNCGLRFLLSAFYCQFISSVQIVVISFDHKSQDNYNPVQWFRNMDYFFSLFILLSSIRRIHLFSCWYEPFIGISFLLSRGNISKWNFPVCHLSWVIVFVHITCTPQLGLCMTQMIY